MGNTKLSFVYVNLAESKAAETIAKMFIVQTGKEVKNF